MVLVTREPPALDTQPGPAVPRLPSGVEPPSWKPTRVPTFRVIYDPRPGVRLLIEDVEADAIIQTPLHLVLTVDALVVGQPREVVALRVRRRDMTAVLRLCATSARWGGVMLDS